METLYIIYMPTCDICQALRSRLNNKNYNVKLIHFSKILSSPRISELIHYTMPIPAIYVKENDKYVQKNVLDFFKIE